AEADGDIARRPGAGAEVLMEHVIWRCKAHAVAPVDTLEIAVALVPEERVARAGDEEDVQAGPVPVPLLVGADRHFRDMRAHGAFAQQQLDVRGAGATRLPGFHLQRAEVGNEIGLTQIAARPDRGHLALAAIMSRQAFALGEGEPIVEKERFVVEDVHEDAERVRAGEAHRLAARRVEDLVARVDRRVKRAARPPFERVFAATGYLDHNAAHAGDDIEHLVEQVLLRRRFAAGRHFNEEHRHPVAAALQMHECAVAAVAEPRPRPGFGDEHVDAEILVYRDALPLGPVEIGIEQEFRLGRGHDAFSARFSSKYLPIFEATPVLASSLSQIAWMRGSWSS